MAKQDEIRRVRSHLRRREWLFWFKIAGMILLGLPLSFLAPFLLSAILWFASLWASTLFHLPSLAVPWLWLFLVPAIVIVPIFYYLELRGNGDDSKAVPVPPPGKAPPGGLPASAIRVTTTAAPAEPASASAGLSDLLFIGSRMVVSACRQVRAVRRVRPDRDRAALIAHTLIVHDRGLETARLLLEGEQIADIQGELAYLAFHEWIAIGEKRGRVWLYTAARRTLES